MARGKGRGYTPAISRLTCCALYHEARRRGVPMTRLADELLAGALSGTAGWRAAEEQIGDRPDPSGSGAGRDLPPGG